MQTSSRARSGLWLWCLLGIVAAACCLGYATAAIAEPAARWPVTYVIDAKYDAVRHIIQAQETITWTNQTSQATAELQFHLYLNAFANNRSSFMKESGSDWEGWSDRDPDAWGYTTLNSLHVGGDDLRGRVQFIHPDDDNGDDRTVAQLLLPMAVRPGESIEVRIDFTAKLPRLFARSGYAGPFAMVAQWFPKLGVFEDGRWVCHQYHDDGEFYADFASYDVHLTVPVDGVVGATGMLREERNNEDGTRTLHFVAEDVHDFAWAVDPRFRVLERRIHGVPVRLLLQPSHLDQARRHFSAIGAALHWYRDQIGRYPYGQLTIVDPGPGGGAAGGMEYPTLITVGTRWWMPKAVRFPELVTVHEFGHQYWYGMVASNEAEEAWLDEGINTYVEGLIMDAAYQPGSYFNLLGLRLDAVAGLRLQYLRSAQHDPLTRRAWEFLDGRSYDAISYAKTALMLRTLNGLLGNDSVPKALRAYFERWRFKHPTGKDFWAAMREAGDPHKVEAIETQVGDGTGVLDYAVTRVSAEEQLGFAGYQVTNAGEGKRVEAEPETDPRYHNEVVVERLGEVRLPVAIQIVFDDGSQVSERWDGESRWKRFEYSGAQRVEWAIIDPEHTLPLDMNWINNSRMRSGGTRGLVRITGRWAVWLQTLLHLLSGF